MSTDWRRAMADLGRGAPKVHPPLAAPILFTAAAEIEALTPAVFAADPTKIVKGVSELARMLGLNVAFTGVPCGTVAEALGATLDGSRWPPTAMASGADITVGTDDFENFWQRSNLFVASLEATKRLAGAGRLMAFVGIEGPTRLCGQIFQNEALSERTGDFVGRILAVLVRELAQAGASAVVMIDDAADGTEYRSSAIRTACNVARFHKLPLFSIYSGGDGTASGEPLTAIPCLAPGVERPAGRAFGTVLATVPDSWSTASADNAGRLVTTAGEVPPTVGIEALGRAIPPLIERFPQ